MKSIFLWACIWICLFLLPHPVLAGNQPPEVGEVLPGIILKAPSAPEHLKYLGLKAAETFTIPQIKANVVIVEIFSMYCPHCQKEAPTVNTLFNKMANDATLKDKMKLMGKLWFPVLSDFWPHGQVADRYGVLRSDGVSERALFIIDKQGVIRYTDVNDINKRPGLKLLVTELRKINTPE